MCTLLAASFPVGFWTDRRRSHSRSYSRGYRRRSGPTINAALDLRDVTVSSTTATDLYVMTRTMFAFLAQSCAKIAWTDNKGNVTPDRLQTNLPLPPCCLPFSFAT